MRLILLAAVLVLSVMECESVSSLTRKRGRCGDDTFLRRQNLLKKHSGNKKEKHNQCLRAKKLTKHCFKSKEMSEEELFDKWFKNAKCEETCTVVKLEEAQAKLELHYLNNDFRLESSCKDAKELSNKCSKQLRQSEDEVYAEWFGKFKVHCNTCNEEQFQDVRSRLESDRGDLAKRYENCRLAADLTLRCYKRRQGSSDIRSQRKSRIEIFNKYFMKHCQDVRIDVEAMYQQMQKKELFDIVEKVESCIDKVNNHRNPNYAYTLSKEVNMELGEMANYVTVTTEGIPKRDYFNPTFAQTQASLKAEPLKATSAESESEATSAESESEATRVRYSKLVEKQVSSLLQDVKKRYCMDRNLRLILGSDAFGNSIFDFLVRNKRVLEAGRKIIGQEIDMYDCEPTKFYLESRCRSLYDFDSLEAADGLLQKRFSGYAAKAYSQIDDFINNQCKEKPKLDNTEKKIKLGRESKWKTYERGINLVDFDFKNEIVSLGPEASALARSVCILQARGRGLADQLAYADNFFNSINDMDIVTPWNKIFTNIYHWCKLQ